ncbi:hypothetical protein [Halorussus lipolyticus]|uniref:hypothetical protein n=1 Tax=Halorussus lipolyticus TaxID=3034024 RepID=UPI0023E7B1AD|nr:hypothetical protein [Halorussus sp. DT80]
MEFDVPDDRTGVRIFDPIENARFELYTPESVELEPASTDEFHFPVNYAVGFDARAVEVPKLVSTVVRSRDGEMLADATASEIQTFETGTYLVELQSTPMKLYLTVEGPMEIHPGETSVTVKFGENRHVRVGARSFHERPVGTITVTDEIEDVMAAISHFGSALKTTTCERSFPTLRGHPPRIERGDEFDVLDGIEKPDTGVELVLPPDREYVYPASSLAYYLGAEVVPGSDPRLVAGDFEYALDGPGGYEATVNRVLKQVFFLDCLTRTEGYYPVELHERQQVEPSVDLDFADLYDRPLAAQLPAYLSVPFEVLEPHLLDWHLTTDIASSAENVAALPYFADELSLLRTPDDPQAHSVEPAVESVERFTRSAVAEGDFTRSASDDADWNDEMFQVEPAETIEHAWVGEGYPINANKVTIDSLHREAERTAPDDSAIEVHVVCNDPRMAEENVVGEFYGRRDFVNYEVEIHDETTTDELAALFESESDFLHYIGHVDAKGFQCDDGYLDAESLDSVGVEAFLLNACRSYEQGATLVEKGSRGGVVTLAEVVHSSATKIGRALARLLNSGFSLRSALNIAKDEVVVSIEYVTVGDGGLTLCESESGSPLKYRIQRGEDGYLVSKYSYVNSTHRLGTLARSTVEETTRYLGSGLIGTFEVTRDEVDSILDKALVPVEIDGELCWSQDISASDLD